MIPTAPTAIIGSVIVSSPAHTSNPSGASATTRAVSAGLAAASFRPTTLSTSWARCMSTSWLILRPDRIGMS